MNHVFLLILMSIVFSFYSLSGCSSTEGKMRGEHNPSVSEEWFYHTDFKTSISLHGEIVHEINPKLHDLRDLLVIDGQYILYGGLDGTHALHLYDMAKDKVISFGRLGTGPGKFIGHTGISYLPATKQIWAFDISQRIWNAFDLERIVSEEDAFVEAIAFEYEGISYPQWVSPDSIAFLTIGDSNSSRFFYSDASGKFIGELGDMPTSENEEVTPAMLSQAYQAMLKVSPNSESIYLATLYADRLEGYDRSGHQYLDLRGPEEIKIVGSIVNLAGMELFSHNQYSKSGYSDISITDDFLYLLFSGRNDTMATKRADKKIVDYWVAFSDEVLILSPEGDRLVKLLLDREIIEFHVSTDDQYLYGLDYRNKQVVRYALDKTKFHD